MSIRLVSIQFDQSSDVQGECFFDLDNKYSRSSLVQLWSFGDKKLLLRINRDRDVADRTTVELEFRDAIGQIALGRTKINVQTLIDGKTWLHVSFAMNPLDDTANANGKGSANYTIAASPSLRDTVTHRRVEFESGAFMFGGDMKGNAEVWFDNLLVIGANKDEPGMSVNSFVEFVSFYSFCFPRATCLLIFVLLKMVF